MHVHYIEQSWLTASAEEKEVSCLCTERVVRVRKQLSHVPAASNTNTFVTRPYTHCFLLCLCVNLMIGTCSFHFFETFLLVSESKGKG